MRLLALTFCLMSAGPAMAGLAFCNETNAPAQVAIGYQGDRDWISEGWWNVAPDACSVVIEGDLGNRFYYWHATTDTGSFASGAFSFCVADKAFTIKGDTDCEARGHRKASFAEEDTGDSKDYTISLTPVDAPRAQAPKPKPAPKTPDLAALNALLQGAWMDQRDQEVLIRFNGPTLTDYFNGLPLSFGRYTLQPVCEGHVDGPYVRVVYDDMKDHPLCWRLMRLNSEEFHFQAVGKDSLVRMRRK